MHKSPSLCLIFVLCTHALAKPGTVLPESGDLNKQDLEGSAESGFDDDVLTATVSTKKTIETDEDFEVENFNEDFNEAIWNDDPEEASETVPTAPTKTTAESPSLEATPTKEADDNSGVEDVSDESGNVDDANSQNSGWTVTLTFFLVFSLQVL